MTKEELEKEAEEYLAGENHFYGFVILPSAVAEAYIKGAEPREKQIQIDAEQIRALQKDKGELTDKVQELEAQIEKMKCCEMCKHKNLNWGFSPICEARDNIKIENPLTCKCDKWEIKEK